VEFIKMHGLGNDFIVLDYFAREPGDVDYAALARELCHRQFGIGGDGLIIILPSGVADARMRIINLDGSEAEMCGNGIRCCARYTYERGYVCHNPLRIETLAGVLTLELTMVDDRVTGVKVDMGEPVLAGPLIPVALTGEPVVGAGLEAAGREFEFTAVSMGNPHCVIFGAQLSDRDFRIFGPAIERHELFPRRTNVEFTQVDSPTELTVRVWERGAGPTLACGTGACAAAVAAILNGLTERRVTVHLPGGDLLVEWAADNHVYMTGPATYVFRGEWLGTAESLPGR